MKLISMTDFVLNVGRPDTTLDFHEMDYYHKEYECIEKITNYANFLKKPLTLGMFVPCDESGNVLKEPDASKFTMDNVNSFDIFRELSMHYRTAKERVLFEIPNLDDLETIKKCIKGETIEMLADGTLTLTTSAIKQLGL